MVLLAGAMRSSRRARAPSSPKRKRKPRPQASPKPAPKPPGPAYVPHPPSNPKSKSSPKPKPRRVSPHTYLKGVGWTDADTYIYHPEAFLYKPSLVYHSGKLSAALADNPYSAKNNLSPRVPVQYGSRLSTGTRSGRSASPRSLKGVTFDKPMSKRSV